MAFNETQVKSLEAKLNAKHVRTRQANDTTLTYVEGWHVIAEANRIFGYDAWDRRTLSTQCVWSSAVRQQHAAAYIARDCRAGRRHRDHTGGLRQRRRQSLKSGRGARAGVEGCRDGRHQAGARHLR